MDFIILILPIRNPELVLLKSTGNLQYERRAVDLESNRSRVYNLLVRRLKGRRRGRGHLEQTVPLKGWETGDKYYKSKQAIITE